MEFSLGTELVSVSGVRVMVIALHGGMAVCRALSGPLKDQLYYIAESTVSQRWAVAR